MDPMGREGLDPKGRRGRALGWGRLDQSLPQTEGSIGHGFRARGRVDDEWGRSESLDPDNVGDIADEGMGHRG
jgi:hypothetical protein